MHDLRPRGLGGVQRLVRAREESLPVFLAREQHKLVVVDDEKRGIAGRRNAARYCQWIVAAKTGHVVTRPLGKSRPVAFVPKAPDDTGIFQLEAGQSFARLAVNEISHR